MLNPVEVIKRNPCFFATVHDVMCTFNMSRTVARMLITQKLFGYYVNVGNMLISKCALEKAVAELRSYIEYKGGYYGKVYNLLSEICTDANYYKSGVLMRIIKLAFPDAKVYMRRRKPRVSIKVFGNGNGIPKLFTLQKILCNKCVK